MVALQSSDSHHSSVEYEMQYTEAPQACLKMNALEMHIFAIGVRHTI